MAGQEARYRELAGATGLQDSAAVRDFLLRAAISRLSIPVYPMGDVEAYLRALTAKLTAALPEGNERIYYPFRWEWRVLRDMDANPDQRRFRFTGGPLPFRVLERAAAISQEVPGVVLWASQIVRHNTQSTSRDPFLAVSAGFFTEQLVVDQWDEPDFPWPVA